MRKFSVLAAIILLLPSVLPRELAFILPDAPVNVTDVCCMLRGFRCTSAYSNAGYAVTDMTDSEAIALLSAATNMTDVRVSTDVLQDATPGTLFPASVQRGAPKVDVAFSYDADVNSGRRLSQFEIPVINSNIQVGAPYHLTFLNNKQSSICQITNSTCQFGEDSYVYSGTAKGVKVYAIGEAINGAHRDLVGVDGATSRVSMESYVFSGYRTDEVCSRWQGTHVAALIAGNFYGVAKKAELISVAVKPGCRQTGSARALADGLWWILKHHESHPGQAVVVVDAKVSVRQPNMVVVDIIESLVNDIIDRGVPVVATAGESRVDACDFTPGRMTRAVTAAGAEIVQLPTRLAARPWLESNYGKCVNIWAPGARIESAFAPDTDSTAVYSGTTPASGMVSAVIASLMQRYPDDTIEVILERMYNASSSSIMLYSRPDTVSYILQNPVA